MRKTLFAAMLVACSLVAAPMGLAQAQSDSVAQMQLSDAQIQQYLDASPEVEAVMTAAPDAQSDGPDAKTIAKLEDVAKKHKFANYGELDTVAGNILLVLEGVDPQTKKYIGAEAALKKQIAIVQADKQKPAEDKKSEIAELNNELKTIVPVKVKSNIDLVLKYYDKLAVTQDQDLKQ